MLKTRIKHQATATRRAVARLADVEASVMALGDEDLLDLADIFSGPVPTALGEMATAEMRKRKLSL